MLRFEMSSPTPLVFITRANQNWYYRPPFIEGERKDEKDVPGGQTISRFFDALSEGLVDNNFYKVKRLGKQKSRDKLSEGFCPGGLELKNAYLVFQGRNIFSRIFLIFTLTILMEKRNKIKFNDITLVDEFFSLELLYLKRK